jgi:two-component sensor histidine kinase/tetratricopeptide (TPR) repeat protein
MRRVSFIFFLLVRARPAVPALPAGFTRRGDTVRYLPGGEGPEGWQVGAERPCAGLRVVLSYFLQVLRSLPLFLRSFSARCVRLGLLLAAGMGAPAQAQPGTPAWTDSLRAALRLTRPDTNRVNLLVALGQAYIAGERKPASAPDTALLLSGQAYALSRSLNYPRGQGLSHLVAARAYRAKKQPQQGKRYAEQAIGLLTRHGSFRDQVEAYVERSSYWEVSEGGVDESIRLNDKIISLLRQLRDTLQLADELVHRGDLYQLQSKNAEALLFLREALSLYGATGHRHIQLVYDRLGFVSGKMGDYEAAVTYGMQAVKTAEQAGDSARLGEIYNRLGITYKEMNRPEKALLYYNKSLRAARTQYAMSTIILVGNTITDMVEVYTSVPNTFTRKEAADVQAALAHLREVIARRPQDRNDVDCRVAVASCLVGYYGRLQRQYAKAQPYCDELEALLRADLGDDYLVFIHSILIPFYVSSRQYQQAQALLIRNEQLCRKRAYLKQLSHNHLWWFRLDSAQARLAPAIVHFQHYKTLNDSLIDERTRQRTTLLEVQYETQEKEHRIVALRQESKLRESELQRAKTTRNYIVAVAAMLLLLLGVIYNRYRLKRRINRQLQAQREELQAQQEELKAHHEELQAQQEVLQVQQKEIHQKNAYMSELLTEKDTLLGEKEELIREKDALLSQQERLLAEKERLLKEIHHRVKNNLQVVMSLLNSQADSLQDKAALSAIQESQHRVQAMALIHQKLYQAEGVARIPMHDYIEEVVAYLHESYYLDQLVRFQVEVDPIELDVTQAVPLGLIINEVITNAFKYAFPEGRPGTVRLTLLRLAEATYQLTIADDGVGLPAHYDPSQSRSLGMTLLHGFSAQLGGELVITSQAGLCISLVFVEEKLGPVQNASLYA